MQYRSFKRSLSLILGLFLIFGMIFGVFGISVRAANGDVAVVFTNDIHGGVEHTDKAIGYAGLAAYKADVISEYTSGNIYTVDCGDHLQGSSLGLLSRGAIITEIMNEVGFDLTIMGNHECDFGIAHFYDALEHFDGQYLCCNLNYSGSNQTIKNKIKPYAVKTFNNGTKVAFIGVATPTTIKASTPMFYMEDGKIVYDFYDGDNGQRFYNKVQETVNKCKTAENPDFVVVLSHAGNNDGDAPYRSTDLIAHTTGIDVVLDGHSHSVVNTTHTNADGQPVLLAQTGTELNNVGKLVLNKIGHQCNIELISATDYTEENATIKAYIDQCIQASGLNTVIGETATKIAINDENGKRLVRNRECSCGNLFADALRARTGAEIALINAGSVRADIPAGPVTVASMVKVHPYVNYLCAAKISGQTLADILEFYYKDVPTDRIKEDGTVAGEFGSFAQISGLKLTVDTAVPSSIIKDASSNFIGIGDTRRVRDIQVLQADGSYTPLEPDRVYTVGGSNYLFFGQGDGIGTYLADRVIEVVHEETERLLYEELSTYVKDDLKGDLSRYASVGNRINIVQHVCEECCERVNQKDATTEAEGYTGDLRCKYCHKVLAQGQTIPKLENAATGVADQHQTEAIIGYALFALLTSCGLIVIKRRHRTK